MQFEWLLGDDTVAVGYVAEDGAAWVTVTGFEPVGFVSVEAMQERFAAMPSPFELRWIQ